jgi:NH3-dependent NAD+ synthetase
MDGANKSMLKTSYTYSTRYGDKQVDAATTFDVNKTLMRCLVKNLAMFGLGIYIYAGEDLPEAETTAPTPAPAKAKPTTGLIDLAIDDENWKGVVKYVQDNKQLGFDKLGQQLCRKYSMTKEVQQAIVNLIR